MRDNIHRSWKFRKPNENIWVCPFTGKEINSRGAAAYLRNKYRIRWKQEYLNNSGLLQKRKESFTKTPLYRNVKEIFADIEFDESDFLIANVIDKYFFLTVDIRRSLPNNKYLLEIIYKDLSGITYRSSKSLPKPYGDAT